MQCSIRLLINQSRMECRCGLNIFGTKANSIFRICFNNFPIIFSCRQKEDFVFRCRHQIIFTTGKSQVKHNYYSLHLSREFNVFPEQKIKSGQPNTILDKSAIFCSGVPFSKVFLQFLRRLLVLSYAISLYNSHLPAQASVQKLPSKKVQRTSFMKMTVL